MSTGSWMFANQTGPRFPNLNCKECGKSVGKWDNEKYHPYCSKYCKAKAKDDRANEKIRIERKREMRRTMTEEEIRKEIAQGYLVPKGTMMKPRDFLSCFRLPIIFVASFPLSLISPFFILVPIIIFIYGATKVVFSNISDNFKDMTQLMAEAYMEKKRRE